MSEKRGYIRYILQGSVNIKTESDTPNIFKADLIDINILGLSVYLKEKIELGAIVQLELTTILLSKPLICKGRIKNVTEVKKYGFAGFKIAIELVEIDKIAIESLLNKIETELAEERRRRLERWQSDTPNVGPF